MRAPRPLLLVPSVLAALAAVATTQAAATDGVIELNQAKVMASGGFPFTISQSGSYRLTSNLDVTGLAGAADTGVIVVAGATFVSIDLNGFGLIGPANCGDTCTNTGTGDGISIFNQASFSISNGFVRGMGDKGIFAAPGWGRVERVEVLHNGGNGIEIPDGFVKDSIARNNGGHGIVGPNLVISGTTATLNLGRGIWAIGPATVVNCSVYAAPNVPGVKLTGGSLLNSSVRANSASALECDGTCTLGGNTFVNCAGLAGCISGAAPFQVPAGSNVCGSGLCS
jgi:hypothetical protein